MSTELPAGWVVDAAGVYSWPRILTHTELARVQRVLGVPMRLHYYADVGGPLTVVEPLERDTLPTPEPAAWERTLAAAGYRVLS